MTTGCDRAGAVVGPLRPAAGWRRVARLVPGRRARLTSGLRGWVIAGSLMACSRGDAEPAVPRGVALDELERFALIPAGTGLLPGLTGPYGVFEDLFFDRFEATRADWERVFGRPLLAGEFLVDAAQTDASRLDWPAFCSLLEAREFARLRSMRLPTESEWRYVAGGASAQRYPWGRARNESFSNTLHLGIGRPLPVGCFERGQSVFGCYDMTGNVREWVEHSERPELIDHGIALGGSYLTWLLELPDPLGRSQIHEGTRTPDLGVRCAASAREWLEIHRDRLSEAPNAKARLRAVGWRFGSAAIPLLSDLLEEYPRNKALRALLEGTNR